MLRYGLLRIIGFTALALYPATSQNLRAQDTLQIPVFIQDSYQDSINQKIRNLEHAVEQLNQRIQEQNQEDEHEA